MPWQQYMNCVSNTWIVSAGALQRLGLDQLLFAPFFIGTFFTCLLTLEVGGQGLGRALLLCQLLNPCRRAAGQNQPDQIQTAA